MANLAQIEKYLRQQKIPFEVIDLGEEIFTVKGVADAGVNEGEIVKTLIVKTFQNTARSEQNLQYFALALRGTDRVDFKKVRELFGNKQSLRSSQKAAGLKAELAKPDEVLKVCGVPIGAVCPILLEIPVYFDERVMSLSHINMGSGDLTKGLEMEFSDLLKAVSNYQVEDFLA